MVDSVQAGRDSADLAREFEPSAEPIRAWVALAIVTVTNSKIFAEPVFNYTRDFPFI